MQQHFNGPACSVPATGEGIDNLLGELRRVTALRIYELRPDGEASRLANERWAERGLERPRIARSTRLCNWALPW